MRQIPARVSPDQHAAMTDLAAEHGRGVGEEYRAAIDAWLEQHAAQAASDEVAA